jgi:hypothetical protein
MNFSAPEKVWAKFHSTSNPQLGLMMTRANAYSFGV